MRNLVGEKVENYKVISLLGKGGMGTVYKAHDAKLDRYVAIKILSAHVVDKQRVIERFKKEAKNQAQLSHPNITTVYGFLEYQEMFGIVMEYVDGESLEKVIYKNKRLHIYDVVYITRQLSEGIGYAHSKGYIHRDVKPSNIIVNSEGTVKIMDFGISKSLYDRGTTKTGAKIGTIYYMSPEQIKGRDVTHLTDIYSIGCTTYEMLIGTPPFDSQSEYEVMDNHLHKNPPTVSQILPGTPVELDKIVKKMLEKNPKERYQSCAEIINSLSQLDQYLKENTSKYFVKSKQITTKSKVKSIISFSLIILLFMGLVYFSFYQVKEFMINKKYMDFEKYSINKLFESNESKVFSDIDKIDLSIYYSLNSVNFSEKGRGLIVGDSGVVAITGISDTNWSVQTLDKKIKFFDAIQLNNDKIIIVGDNNVIIYSDDNLKNYQWYSAVEGDYTFFKINFINNQIGYIVGTKGIMLKTTNGGTWWDRLNTGVNIGLYDLVFLDNMITIAIGWNGIILKSDNSGDSWMKIESNTNKYLRSIDFLDDEIGLIVGGNGTILRTENGGNDWEEIASGYNRSFHDVKFISEEVALIVGSQGTIIISEDKGENWKAIETNFPQDLNSISKNNSGEIYIAGVNGTLIKLK